jgi:hypothetical protein
MYAEEFAMKRLIKLVVGLVLLLIVGLVVALFYIDGIAKSAIEKGGTYALGVDTAVEGADVGIFSGELSLSGVKVDNPEGYAADHFMELGEGEMAVSLGTLRQDVVVVPRLILTDLDVALQRTPGGTNYGVILDSLKRFEATEPDPNAKRYVIDELVISDIDVRLDLFGGAAGLGGVDLPIDEIRLEDVGTAGRERGVVMGELVNIIVKSVMQVVLEEGGALIPADLQSQLQGKLAQLEDLDSLGIELMSKFTGDLGALRDGLGENLLRGEGLEGAGEALGDLLGGDDDDDGNDAEGETEERPRRRDRENREGGGTP